MSIIQGTSKAAGGGYAINQSIRFNNDDNPYLTRTPSSAGNRRTYTYSVWLKRGDVEPGYNMGLLGSGPNKDNRLYFRTNTALQFVDVTGGAVPFNVQTNAVLRDPSAWYHVVLAVDTTDSTASNRVKIYINGTLQTSLATASYPTQNLDTRINTTDIHYISKIVDAGGATEFDGYMAEINFIDGQQLDPTSFGEVNSNTGQWIAKQYDGSYGTNGFYLTGANSSDFGEDFSGNNNDWTSSGLAAADQMSDSPTNNWCVLNSVSLASTATLSDGNLTLSNTSTGATTGTLATPSSGKWYFEVNFYSQSAATTAQSVGVVKAEEAYITGTNGGGIYFFTDGGLRIEGSDTGGWGSAWGVGDTIGVAIDLDANKIWFAIDNTWQASGDPSAGTNPAASGFSSEPYVALIRNGNSSRTTVWTANFGQSAFAYTPPTDFLALNTDNLPDPTIANGSEYFHPQLYFGTGSSGLAITNDASAGDFKPDILWLSPRSNGDNKVFFDSVRGTTQRVKSNSSDAEDTDGTAQITFETDGFDLDTTDPNFNGSERTYVAWQWHTTGGTSSSNTDGDITSTVSANTTSGVAVLTYTGNGSDNQTIGHGIGIAPKMIITKRRDSSGNWTTYHDAVGINKVFYLNSTAAPSSNTEQYRAVPTSSVYTVGVGGDINSSGGTYVAYCFAEVDGFSKFGSYEGNGSTDGPFVYTGFKPRFVMIKRYDSTESWPILDTARGSGNFGSAAGTGGTDPTAGNDLNAVLVANTSAAEEDNPAGSRRASYLSNGFKVRTTNTAMNASGGDYLYMAFAESPFKTSTAR